MAIDPKVWNLCRFLIVRIVAVVALFYAFVWATGLHQPLQIIGSLALMILAYRVLYVSIYRRRLLPPKDPLEYGKWAIVTGSTSGIGKEFADYLARKGMNILLTSRSVDKLTEQKKLLSEQYGVEVDFLAFDYTKTGEERRAFYKILDAKCAEINGKGGLGLLVNNVGISNEIPMNIDEFTVSY